jgi:hypothetical protein
MVFFFLQVKSRRKKTVSPTAISFPKRQPGAVPSPNPPSPPANMSYRQGCGSISGSAWIRINLSCWIRIQGCKNDLQMYKKVKNFHVLKCWMFFLRAEGFSCSLCVVYGGLVINKLQFFIKKYPNFFPAVDFFQFLIIKTPGLRTGSGSATMKKCWIRIRMIKALRIINNPA